MTIDRLSHLSAHLLSRPVLARGVSADQAEVAARRLAHIGPEWVTLTVRCRFVGAHFNEASGADLMFERRDGRGGTTQHRTVAVDFVHAQVEFDFTLDD
jgi:hypothetical protein